MWEVEHTDKFEVWCTRNYRILHDEVVARPGAAERLAVLRDETLAEIGLHVLRRVLERSQTDLPAELGISQSAVSQLERGDDVKVSTLCIFVVMCKG